MSTCNLFPVVQALVAVYGLKGKVGINMMMMYLCQHGDSCQHRYFTLNRSVHVSDAIPPTEPHLFTERQWLKCWHKKGEKTGPTKKYNAVTEEHSLEIITTSWLQNFWSHPTKRRSYDLVNLYHIINSLRGYREKLFNLSTWFILRCFTGNLDILSPLSIYSKIGKTFYAFYSIGWK